MKKYLIFFSSTARKHFESIDARYKRLISRAIESLIEDPHIGVPLRGELRGLWKLRVSHYRIVYEIYELEIRVYVIDINHRKDVYR